MTTKPRRRVELRLSRAVALASLRAHQIALTQARPGSMTAEEKARVRRVAQLLKRGLAYIREGG
jgi:hypothetical protein